RPALAVAPTARPRAGAGQRRGRQQVIGVGDLPTPMGGFLPLCHSPRSEGPSRAARVCQNTPSPPGTGPSADRARW
ncbi:hypothetical protein HMPREF9005_2079, partial [Actinomyces sp. oral taxon 178 str. F0338]